jgi:hypothetical protein
MMIYTHKNGDVTLLPVENISHINFSQSEVVIHLLSDKIIAIRFPFIVESPIVSSRLLNFFRDIMLKDKSEMSFSYDDIVEKITKVK